MCRLAVVKSHEPRAILPGASQLEENARVTGIPTAAWAFHGERAGAHTEKRSLAGEHCGVKERMSSLNTPNRRHDDERLLC